MNLLWTATHRRAFCLLALLGTTISPQASFGDEPLRISGIYPHLATHNQPAEIDDRPRHGECGIGAIVPWAGRLWYITYPQHKTTGGNDKLYEVDSELNLTIRPESVGGTHAGRMIHRESNQLIIGPYFIDAAGNVRSVDLQKLRGRMTAVMRHLTDPANKVYFFDMEGAIYEVDVHSLEVARLFTKPVPGWHGKGGYTAQNRVVIANNGESGPASMYEHLLVGGPAQGDEAGVLAEWDGQRWEIVRRTQFTDVTGPGGIYGSPDDRSPLWAIGWDRRSVILQLLDGGSWHSFRMPKASHTFDPTHGWFTEWPRIREIAPGHPIMCMHGQMFDFPKGFSTANTAGVRSICTHLRYIPDFCHWNGRLILGADDASMMGNPMCGQGQSNLWFGTRGELSRFGPRAGWGGPWLGDRVEAGVPSDPFLLAGFKQRCLHLATDIPKRPALGVLRSSDKFAIKELPDELRDLLSVTVRRGDYHQPAPGYSFTVDRDALVYLAVDDRGESGLDDTWQKTDLSLQWNGHSDSVYVRPFKGGRVTVPARDVEHGPDAYPLPNMCFVGPASSQSGEPQITDVPKDLMGRVGRPAAKTDQPPVADVTFTLEIDAKGDGRWTEYRTIRIPADGYACHVFEEDLVGEWIRIKSNKNCHGTAYFHYWSPREGEETEASIFEALATVDSPSDYTAGIIRPAEHNRSLQWLPRSISNNGEPQDPQYVEVELEGTTKLTFTRPKESRADEVNTVAAVEPDHSVDAASVIVEDHNGNRFRLPKGDEAFDHPLPGGPARGIRECVSERFLANLHGTFYEIPRQGRGHSPDFSKIKPVASHDKLIADFCTWRGLMVISGTRANARRDGQFFADGRNRGLWFGAIDDLWKLGKPIGRGGPWLKTPVQAGRPSDPYLMTGYDEKRLELSHDGDTSVTFEIQIDFDHRGFRTYKTLDVPAGRKLVHCFGKGFHAHWARVTSDRDCTATAWFVYE